MITIIFFQLISPIPVSVIWTLSLLLVVLFPYWKFFKNSPSPRIKTQIHYLRFQSLFTVQVLICISRLICHETSSRIHLFYLSLPKHTGYVPPHLHHHLSLTLFPPCQNSTYLMQSISNIWVYFIVSIGLYISFFFLFFFATPQHMEVPRTGIKSELQLRPMPQLRQCWILNPLCHKWELLDYIFLENKYIILYIYLFFIALSPCSEKGKKLAFIEHLLCAKVWKSLYVCHLIKS